MTADHKRDYPVGYGKPPRHTRFRKGRSGNPCGRPRGSKNLSTLLHETLNERVVVAENGGRRTITKQQAIITQVVNKAAQGDWPSIKILLDIQQASERRTEPESSENAFGAAADEKVFELLKARLGRNKGQSDE